MFDGRNHPNPEGGQIGNRVRFVRRFLRMTQSELASRTGVWPAYIGEVERHMRFPDPAFERNLLRLFVRRAREIAAIGLASLTIPDL